jgi:hypothetical protein
MLYLNIPSLKHLQGRPPAKQRIATYLKISDEMLLVWHLLQDGLARKVQFCGQLEALICNGIIVWGYVCNNSYMDTIRNLNNFKTTKRGGAGQVTRDMLQQV